MRVRKTKRTHCTMMKSPSGFTREMDRLEREATKGARTDRPIVLPLKALQTCSAVFQPRLGKDRNGAHNPDHVRALVHQLDTMPANSKALEPIVVYAIGKKFYTLDGHHRRAAYHAAGITEAIPVTYFEGTLAEAIREACRLNSKVYLNMENADRNEAAWRMTCVGETLTPRTTVDAIVEASRLGRRSVENMRALYRRLQERFAETCEITGERLPATFDSYREALQMDRGTSKEYTEEAKQALISEMVDKLGKALGKHPHRHPDETGEALFRYLGATTFAAMAEAQGYVKVDLDAYEAFQNGAPAAGNPQSLDPAICGSHGAARDRGPDPSLISEEEPDRQLSFHFEPES